MKKNLKKTALAGAILALFFSVFACTAQAADEAVSTVTRIEAIAGRLYASTGIKARISLRNDVQVDAYVLPDRSIVITTALATDCSDDELAFIIGHELSHIIADDHLGHRVPALKSQAENPSSQLREIIADINAIYYVKKAGFDPASSAPMLRRVGPGSNNTFRKRVDTLETYLDALGRN